MTDVIPTKLVADCSTNTVVEMPLTAEEIAEMQTLAAQAEADRKAAEEAEAAAVADAKASANAKLAKLELTQEEINALYK
jgi:hypothetical protein